MSNFYYELCLEGYWKLQDTSILHGTPGIFYQVFFYLSVWDSRDTKAHITIISIGQKGRFCLSKHNVKFNPLIIPEKVLLPPLHIKLSLIKQFVNIHNKESAASDTFRTSSPSYPRQR